MVHRGVLRRQGHNIFSEAGRQFWNRKADTENKMQEKSTTNRKGRMKESMKRFVLKSGIGVIVEGFTEWSEAGINGSVVRNDRKGEGRGWKGSKPNISLMQECISEKELVIVTGLGCDICQSHLGGREQASPYRDWRKWYWSCRDVWYQIPEKGRTVQTLCEKIRSGCAVYPSVLMQVKIRCEFKVCFLLLATLLAGEQLWTTNNFSIQLNPFQVKLQRGMFLVWKACVLLQNWGNGEAIGISSVSARASALQ